MMDKLYIVVDGIEHQYFDCDSTGYYLISYDPLSENNGYKLFDSELKQYREYLTEKQIEKAVEEYNDISTMMKKYETRKKELAGIIKEYAMNNGTATDTGFILENSKFQYGAIYALTVGAMDYSKFKSRTLDEKAEARYFKFLEEDLQDYDNFQLITGESPMQIAGEIEKYKPDIVFIDGVYLMNDDRKSNTDTEKVYHITADLKRIAKNYKMPIVINSQADKSTSTKTGPELENISYAQSIGRDSDIVMAVYRTEMMYTDKEMGLKVLKNREGTTGKLLISWDFSDMQFKQIYFEKDSGEVVEDGNEEAIQEVNESEGLVEIE